MIVIKPSIEASVPSMPRPYLPVKKSRKPLSFGSIATLILCAAVGGFNVGYTIGVNAYKPQMQDNSGIPREQLCPCNQVQTPNKRLELVNEKEPCPIVTCPVVDQLCPSCRICNDEANKRNDSSLADGLNDRKTDINHEPIFPKSIQKIAVGMSRVPRDEFSTTFDMGIPLQKTVQGNEHVLILYTHNNALPTMAKESYSRGSAPLVTSAEDATANCDYLNVILTDVKYEKKQCVALMGQFEASHIQRWMRLPEKGLQVNSKEPLRFVGRIAKDMGGASVVTAPFPSEANSNREILHKYFEELESVMKELGPLATKVARNNTVVVMFSNFGQSELIVNFYCSAQNRNLDLSSVLFFATDPETKELVESLGMTAFYSEALFGHLPSGAAEVYGDETFSVMMKTKIMCIHLTSLLGFDILFQDADMIWYRDPIPYFQKENLPFFDVFIADDGNDNSIYLPYQGNGGFFYLRNNRKTMYLINAMLLLSDSAIGGDEQYLLNQFLAECASLYGMRVKTLKREEFPTGIVYHNEKDMMKGIFEGSVRPYMFHMSWTLSKTDKLLYFKQMGEWYVEEQCIGSNSTSMVRSSKPGSLASSCCSVKPLISCHFPNKASHPMCNESTTPGAVGQDTFW